jgi:hypothetical protein
VVGSGKHRHREKGKEVFYNHKMPLYKFARSSVSVGQYAFPFAFTLSQNCPGSIFYTNPQADPKAHIYYRLIGMLDNSDEKSGSCPPVKGVVALTVREPIKQAVQAVQGDNTMEVTSWCCCSNGRTRVRCHFEKNAYTSGDIANIICEVDNSQCELDATNIKVNLVRRVSCRIPGWLGDQGKVMNESVFSQLFPGVARGDSAMNEKRRMLSIQLGTPTAPFLNSTSGKIIQCHYFLEVSCTYEGCFCCSSLPNVTIPVTIFAPVPIMEQIQAPANWNPQVMPQVNLSLQSDGLMPAKPDMTSPTMAGVNQMPMHIAPGSDAYVNMNYAPPPAK